MSITILFDNHNPTGGERSLWGFAAYLPDHKLLFDTGSNGRVLLRNMRELGIDITEAEYLFLSHEHWDHIGGVDSVVEANPELTIFVPESFSKNMIADLKRQSKNVIICGRSPRQLSGKLYSTGLLGDNPPEHSLIIDGAGPTLITGCGHYGIDRIAAHAEKTLRKSIQTAIGGFHLAHKPAERIGVMIDTLETMGVRNVMPTHCTGDQAISMFWEAFGEGYHEGGIGAKISIEHPV